MKTPKNYKHRDEVGNVLFRLEREPVVKTVHLRKFYPKRNLRKVHIIKHFLDNDECLELIDLFGEGSQRMEDMFRTNDRHMIQADVWSKKIWTRVNALVDLFSEPDFQPVRCNPRVNIYRYSEGDEFRLHCDQPFILDDEISFYSVLCYLNDDYEGGEAMLGGQEDFKPEAGMAVVFPHYILHGAKKITKGVRYSMRTDVMYKRPA